MSVSPKYLLPVCALAFGLAACQSGPINPAIPSGRAAYAAIPVATPQAAVDAGQLGAGDVLSVRVMQEPDLSIDRVSVSETGTIQIPLAGEIRVAGRTTREVADAITAQLGSDYIRDPQVAVNVIERRPRTITVEGEVGQPGIFPIQDETTLLGALALARSPTQFARRDEIYVFRTVGGQRMAARFDLRQLRAGLVPDPQIIPGDKVVVGYSNARALFQDFLRATPLLNVFTVF